jgi:hypothetical protein
MKRVLPEGREWPYSPTFGEVWNSRKFACRTLPVVLALLFTQLPGGGRLFSVILAHLVSGGMPGAFYGLKCSLEKR